MGKRSNSVMFEPVNDTPKSEKHRDRLGLLTLHNKSEGSSDDDDDLSLGFLLDNFTEDRNLHQGRPMTSNQSSSNLQGAQDI